MQIFVYLCSLKRIFYEKNNYISQNKKTLMKMYGVAFIFLHISLQSGCIEAGFSKQLLHSVYCDNTCL